MTPNSSSSALLAEVETAIALIGLAKISSQDTLPHLHEYTKHAYERALRPLPTGVLTMTHEQELAVWGQLEPVREWLESTAAWLSVPS